ncbi:MAG: O-antigen ligase family protein [Actinobacteria bacterium]|nr:O-antigen ligase family protein [Actinomycetota bacterium]
MIGNLDVEEKKPKSQLSAEVLDRAIVFLLYGTVFLVPLAVFPWTLDQSLAIKYLILKAGTLLAVAFYACRVVLYGVKLRASGIEWPLALFLFLILLSTWSSIHLPTSLEGAFQRYDGLYSQLIYFALFFLAVQYLAEDERRETFLALFVFSASVVSLYGILQQFGIDPTPWGYIAFDTSRSFSTFGNPVLLGAYLSITFFIALGLLYSSEQVIEKTAYAFATALMALCVVLTMGRALWVAVLVGLLVFTTLRSKGLRKSCVTWRSAVGPAVLTLATVVPAIFIVGIPVFSSRVASMAETGGSLGSRLSMWRSALAMIADRPFLGYGPDSVGLVFPRYETAELARIAPIDIQTNVHNAFLQIAVTLGLPALLLFSLILTVFTLKTLNKIRSDGKVSPIPAGLFAGTAAFVIQSATGITGIATSPYLWLGMGALSASWSEERLTIKPPPVLIRFAAVAVIALSLFVGLNSAVKPFLSDIALGQARLAEGAGGFDEAKALYKSAITHNSDDVKAYRELGIALADAGHLSKDHATWSEGVSFLIEASRLSPNDHEAQMFLGQAYLYGARAFDARHYYPAERYLKKAVGLRPFSYAANTMLAVAYIETGRNDRARDSLEIALSINPNDPQAHYYMGRYHEEAGSTGKAILEYRAALILDSRHERAKIAHERLTRDEK